ncbi:hypothetical protein [Sediminibacillus terrae]|uniref:hypothetical protein n=1 Tax=Sediminibacillus terrae TaxID=1562106 RepID=UPI0012961372|nr:hypothetical protein [Sediminibacillus terrae]
MQKIHSLFDQQQLKTRKLLPRTIAIEEAKEIQEEKGSKPKWWTMDMEDKEIIEK